MKTITLDEIEDKYIGKKGTTERDAYDREVELFVIGETIKQARESKSLTQENLGEISLAKCF